VLLHEPHGGFFAVPYAATNFADRIVVIAWNTGPTLLAEDTNLIATVMDAYIT